MLGPERFIMKKLALFFICICSTTLGVAQNTALYGTSGRAVLANSNSQRAEVRFEVVGSPTSVAASELQFFLGRLAQDMVEPDIEPEIPPGEKQEK